MAGRILRANSYQRMPWKNGGGTTTEIFKSTGADGQVQRGVPGGEAEVGEGDLGLLGYDPFAIQAACAALGWTGFERP